VKYSCERDSVRTTDASCLGWFVETAHSVLGAAQRGWPRCSSDSAGFRIPPCACLGGCRVSSSKARNTRTYECLVWQGVPDTTVTVLDSSPGPRMLDRGTTPTPALTESRARSAFVRTSSRSVQRDP
jgi:hypothetical protein